MSINDRFKNYQKNHCWQYQIRLDNYEADLLEAGLTLQDADSLRIDDFNFSFVSKSEKTKCKEISNFIKRHEWLGKMSLYPTHFFEARFRGILAGVITMDVPSSFSKILGPDTSKLRLERLISRGACISWSPKNLASALIMWSIKWSVQNTEHRLFTAYSDPEAMELGSIYQACNFFYLGQSSGIIKKYRYPDTTKWFSDRNFRNRSFYKRYAIELGIPWDKNWVGGKSNDRMLWANVPDDIEIRLRQRAKEHQKMCDVREVPAKHKYAYVLGENKERNKSLEKDI